MLYLENISQCWNTTEDAGREHLEGYLTLSKNPPKNLEDPKHPSVSIDLVLIDTDDIKKLMNKLVYWDDATWKIWRVVTRSESKNDIVIYIKRLPKAKKSL